MLLLNFILQKLIVSYLVTLERLTILSCFYKKILKDLEMLKKHKELNYKARKKRNVY